MSPALSKALLLALPSSVGLVLLLIHGFTFRRKRTMLGFALGAFLFGILRGNIIHWICVDWVRQGSAWQGLMPYIITTPVARIGHASLQEAIGWIFALYLGWCLSEDILRRLGMRQRLYAIFGLTCLFMACICYAVEAGAGALGWWVWTLPIKSRYFLEVPAAGMWAWPSVAVDFFLPFLLIAGGRRAAGPWRWALLLLFPLHMALHAWDPVYLRSGGAVPTPSMYYYMAMLAIPPGLMVWSARKIDVDRKSPPAGPARVARWFPAATALILFADLALGMGVLAGRYDLLVTTAPLLAFILLAVPRIPAWLILIGTAACAPLAGWRGMAALVPPLAYGLLMAGRRWGGLWRFRAALAVVLALIAVGMIQNERRSAQLVRQYVELRRRNGPADPGLDRIARAHSNPTGLHMAAGNAFRSAGQLEQAADEYRKAEALEPGFVTARSELGVALGRLGRFPEALRELEEAVRILPTQSDLYVNLALGYQSVHDNAAAHSALEKALALQPDNVAAHLNLGLLLAAEGDFAKALESLERARDLDPRDPRVQAALMRLRSRPK